MIKQIDGGNLSTECSSEGGTALLLLFQSILLFIHRIDCDFTNAS